MANIKCRFLFGISTRRLMPANQVAALKVRNCLIDCCYHTKIKPQNLPKLILSSIKPWPIQALRLYSNSVPELDILQYNKIADETLENLTEYFESLNDQEILSDDYDVNLASGVLTIHLGGNLGTYVINKQVPNKQIWLSSPLSGPKRYDYIDGNWIYFRDERILHDLLSEELTKILDMKIDLDNLKNKLNT